MTHTNVGRANEEVHGKLLDEVDRLEKELSESLASVARLREAASLSLGWLDNVCDPEHDMRSTRGLEVRRQIESALTDSMVDVAIRWLAAKIKLAEGE